MSNVRYLKKKKMFGLAQKILGSECSVKLLDCEYSFYRGSEWLIFSNDGYRYKLYSCRYGNYLVIEKSFYDNDDVSHLVYRRMLNGFGKCEIVIE